MKAIVVLQARTNSSRLPAKVLLPVAGMPLAVLAARRAASTGLEVIVATSLEESDDALAEVLDQYRIPCFRGDLDDVLGRFVAALQGRPDETIVVRLTADNPFPDGAFLDEMIADFTGRDVEYLCCNGQSSGLPYGMSAEITRLGHLREAAASSNDPFEREHVTPYVIARYGRAWFEHYFDSGYGHYRCTVDGFDDYLNVLKVFALVDDPLREPALGLVHRLDSGLYQPRVAAPAARLVVGTAQLGLDYGIGNTRGRPVSAEAAWMLKTAIGNGVVWLDTARAYGESEEVLGGALRQGWEQRVGIVTKLAPLADCPPDASREVCRAFVDASLFASCRALRRNRLDVVLLHRAVHLHQWAGAVWQRLCEQRAAGLIGQLGVSVQNPEELQATLAVDEVGFVQLPFNLLDHRWDEVLDQMVEVKRGRDLQVHVRSVFLQGLLLASDPKLWQRAHVAAQEAADILAWLEESARRTGRQDVVDLCLAYVRGLKWVDGVVVGMESLAQLERNLQLFDTPALNEEQRHIVLSCAPRVAEETLNPTLWQ